MPRHRGKKGKTGPPDKEVLPACVYLRPKGAIPLDWQKRRGQHVGSATPIQKRLFASPVAWILASMAPLGVPLAEQNLGTCLLFYKMGTFYLVQLPLKSNRRVLGISGSFGSLQGLIERTLC